MIYSQAVLALIADALFWRRVPGAISLLGCVCIVLSLAISIPLARDQAKKEAQDSEALS